MVGGYHHHSNHDETHTCDKEFDGADPHSNQGHVLIIADESCLTAER